MRVTEHSRYDLLRQQLGSTSSNMAEISEKLATGRAINRWSDDPELAVHADRLLSEDRALEAYADAAENARAWLSTQDGALQTSVSVFHRIRELAIAAGSSQGPDAREGIAVELEGIRDQLVGLANTSFDGRSVFGGFGDEAVTDSGGTIVWAGDNGAVQRRIDHDRTVQVNIDGEDAFGFAAGDDVFGIVDDLIVNVRAGDAATVGTTDLARVDTAAERLTEALGRVGSRGNQIERALESGTQRRDEIRAYRSSIVDADLAETALELTIAETAYESVLAATARLQIPSLVDYLR
ncbi:MAG: flagellar hook-associated protein FlgL [Actinomycetota bacterium]